MSLRQVIARAQSISPRTSVTAARCFHVSASSSSAEEGTKAPVKPKVVSSAPKGTILKGINYLKDGTDPVALADSEYPAWLWDTIDPAVRLAKINDPLHKKHHKEVRRQAIKGENFIRDRKT